MHIDELETPAAIVNLDTLEDNINRLQRYLDEHNIANRPHIKTHKVPEIAHMQLDAGAVGITCQKLGEAEVMAQAGIKDIFLPYNIMGKSKLERLMRLARRINISVTADSEYTTLGLSGAAKDAGLELTVLVEFDTGYGRCGVQTPEQAAELARLIEKSAALRFGGLMTYPNNERTDPFVGHCRELLDSDGIGIDIVSGGSTAGMWEVHTHSEISEHRAGMYVYGDRFTLGSGAVKLENCAFNIIATVVSRPTAERAILDAGSKTFSSDLLGLEGHGLILEYPDARISSMSEEHGWVDLTGSKRKPQIGERVTVIPNHCCTASNMFNEVVGMRGDAVEVVWEVAARGKLQ